MQSCEFLGPALTSKNWTVLNLLAPITNPVATIHPYAAQHAKLNPVRLNRL